jgi:hypothetical protein
MSELGPLEATGQIVDRGLVRENLASFQLQFGQDLPDLETKLVLYLKKLPYTDPFAAQPHFVATLHVAEGRKPIRQVNTFHNPTLAQKWLRESVDLLPAETRPKAETAVRSFPNRPTAEAWARQWAGSK